MINVCPKLTNVQCLITNLLSIRDGQRKMLACCATSLPVFDQRKAATGECFMGVDYRLNALKCKISNLRLIPISNDMGKS